MRFKKGDRVMLSKHSQYYGGSDSQLPPDVVGTVRTTYSDINYSVKWVANGVEKSNSYYDGDLVPATKLIHPLLINKQH